MFTIRYSFRYGDAILSGRTRAMASSVSVLGGRSCCWIAWGSRPATPHASASGTASPSASQVLPLTKSRTESSRAAAHSSSGQWKKHSHTRRLHRLHFLAFWLINLDCLQPQMSMTSHPAALHPASMHVSAGMPPRHFLPSPALASPVGSTAGGSQPPPNPPLAANAPCSTLFVANLGQFVSEHELKEIFAR